MSPEILIDCPACGEEQFRLQAVLNYEIQLKHDGKKYPVTVPQMEILRCDACGDEAFGEDAIEAMHHALREQLGLLQPDEILAARNALGMTQVELADHLKLAVGTLSKWENGHQIQQKVMDQFLRTYFRVPEARKFLADPSSYHFAPETDFQIDSFKEATRGVIHSIKSLDYLPRRPTTQAMETVSPIFPPAVAASVAGAATPFIGPTLQPQDWVGLKVKTTGLFKPRSNSQFARTG